MSSSGGDDLSGLMMALTPANPMPGLPVAGSNSTIGDPYQYGKFQNFLPDIKPEGRNDVATGLRPDMFQYRSPGGVVAQGGSDAQIQSLRNDLAKLTATLGAQGAQGAQGPQGLSGASAVPQPHPFEHMLATDWGGGG